MNNGDRRLIEDYLPLDVLNAIAAKEKKHPKHPVALIHYWPARRPTTASRAAVYASLVPAPNSDEERKESESFVIRLAAFKPGKKVVKKASERIRAHHGGQVPKVLDMFAGGGAIPLEAARLGCETHAIDYNPVAHLIELCTLEFPQKFGDSLAEDLESWGQVVMERMRRDLADLYPPVRVPEAEGIHSQMDLFGGNNPQLGRQAEPIAYIWARTVPCRRPGCNSPVPLVRQAWLRKRNGFVAAIPKIDGNSQLCWEIVSGGSAAEASAKAKQTGAGQSACVACNTPVPSNYVKEMSKAGLLSQSLAAIVVDGGRSKLYLPPTASIFPDVEEYSRRLDTLLYETGICRLDEQMNASDSTTVAGRGYGISQWSELFAPRQLLSLFTLVRHIREVHTDMIGEGMPEDRARALSTYLAMAFGRLANSFTKFCRWQGQDQKTISAIGDRQALKMVYDFSEINPFSKTAGCLQFALNNEVHCIRELSKVNSQCTVTRGNAEKLHYDDETFDAVITDPPYYSSIYYADLSAFFYVWLNRILGDLYPEHFTLPTPPKRREAVAQPSEHGGDEEKANGHYQEIMRRSFVEARRVLKPGAPLVCVYAHRTTEGWATLIRALVDAGLTVTEAWPVQTEARGRTNSLKSAALSDSIFFVARRREEARTGQYEVDVEPDLHRIARERVVTLWDGGKGIGGADLLMAAVGAGLRAYTKFAKVEHANGELVTAEQYLRKVEGVVLDVMLDEIFGLRGSAVGSIDPISRFYVLWRFTYRESSIEAGDVYVFCYPQGIEIDGPAGISGPAPALVEKSGSKYRVRNYDERGDNADMGISGKGRQVPLIDVLQRLLWIIDKRPTDLQAFLKASSPNLEQLRLLTQALCAPVLGHPEAKDTTPTAELRALSRLTANWRGIVEGAALADEIERKVTGQQEFSAGG